MFAYIAIARAFLKRIPWQVWAFLALIAVWAWERDSYGDRRAEEARIEANTKCAAKEKARQAALVAKEKENRERARQTDRRVIAKREAVRPSVDAFIARGGVQQAGTDNRGPEGGSAGSSEAVHQAPELATAERMQTVTVYAEDVRICTDGILIAEELRAFVLDLEK